jgi:hypothetical protein
LRKPDFAFSVHLPGKLNVSAFKSIEKFNLSTKLLVGFSITILFSVALSLAAFWTFAKLYDAIDGIYEKDLIGVKLVNQAARDIQILARFINRLGLSHFGNDSESVKSASDIIIKGGFKDEVQQR